MSEPLPASTLRSIIFGDNMDLDKMEDLDAQPDPMQAFIQRNQVQTMLGKSAERSAVLLDMSVPVSDVDEDSFELYKAPQVIRGAVRKTSGTKFVELLAMIRKVFAGHDDEMAEAIETVTRTRDEERAAMIADIAAR